MMIKKQKQQKTNEEKRRKLSEFLSSFSLILVVTKTSRFRFRTRPSFERIDSRIESNAFLLSKTKEKKGN